MSVCVCVCCPKPKRSFQMGLCGDKMPHKYYTNREADRQMSVCIKKNKKKESERRQQANRMNQMNKMNGNKARNTHTQHTLKEMSQECQRKNFRIEVYFWKAKRELKEGTRRRTIAICRRWNK